MRDLLGDRIKRYEGVSNFKLLPKSPLFIRIDGRAFHTFTRGLNKPFSQILIKCMVHAAQNTAKEMAGFKLAYVQSDEATFMITDTDTFETQGWFDYELSKVVSISASAFTAYFNRYWAEQMTFRDVHEHKPKLAMFDSRAFTVPVEDAPNVFVWRQRDWERNSVQMLARSYFSHKECEGKKIPDLHKMLYNKGISWDNLMPELKHGTFIMPRNDVVRHDKVTYDQIKEMIDGDI